MHCDCFQRQACCIRYRGWCIWNIMAGNSAPLHRLLGHSVAIISVAISFNSSLVASLSEDQDVRIWRAETGELLTNLSYGSARKRNPAYSILGDSSSACTSLNGEVSFSADGQVMRSNTFGMKIQDTDWEGPHAEPPIRFSSSGRSMVSVKNLSVLLWTQRATGQWYANRLDSHTDSVRSAIFSPGGLYIASASDDTTIRIWNAGGGPSPDLSPSAVSRQIKIQAMSPEGANIVTVFRDGSVRNWSVGAGEVGLQLPEENLSRLTCIAISSDGSLIALGLGGGVIQLRNAQTGAKVIGPLQVQDHTVIALTFAHDMRFIASAFACGYPTTVSYELSIRIWDVLSGTELYKIQLNDSGHDPEIIISPEGQLIATIFPNGRIRLWQIKADLIEVKLPQRLESAKSLAFSPDGIHIALGGIDGSGYVWNLSTGHMVLTLSGHSDMVLAITYSPDGQLIGTASRDDYVCLWDARTGEAIATLRGYQGDSKFQLLGFTRSGASIVSSSYGGTISVWDVNTAQVLSSKCDEEDILTLSSATLNDGWLTRASGELLLWVPAEYRSHLQTPLCTARVVNQCVVVRTDDVSWNRGPDWILSWCGELSGTVLETP